MPNGTVFFYPDNGWNSFCEQNLMQDTSFNIVFTHNNVIYKGWATPSEHTRKDGSPKSFHVVLNGVMFGNVSVDHNHWTVDEERPEDLTYAVGKSIENSQVKA